MNPIVIVEAIAYQIGPNGQLQSMNVGEMVLGQFQETAPESRNMTGGQDEMILKTLQELGFVFPSGRRSQVQDKALKGKTEKKEEVFPREHGVGSVSKYQCTTCLKHVITIDRHDGVPQAQYLCNLTKHCRGRLRPTAYFGQEEPTVEFRLPTDDEYRSTGDGTFEREFFDGGGLVMAEYDASNPVKPKRAKAKAKKASPGVTQKASKVMPSRRAKLGLEA